MAIVSSCSLIFLEMNHLLTGIWIKKNISFMKIESQKISPYFQSERYSLIFENISSCVYLLEFELATISAFDNFASIKDINLEYSSALRTTIVSYPFFLR